MRVIGTAGHVDHGKSTLIAALTGVHPDRLKEEQEREMTIDLGFGWLSLPDGEEVGIVDVPGHRDFIENMLAGVGGIDAALLIVAADEGVMPQTREHLAILDLLQIQSGIIVVTKVDLVEDPGWLDLVENDIRLAMKGTVLENAPLVRVSARTGFGLDELRFSLSVVLKARPTRLDLGRPRLPIDRVFSMPGFGTVVTGTLVDGTFHTGDDVEILPSGKKGRIRGLQTHKKKEDESVPGSRTAINISGTSVEQISRGEVVVTPGSYQPTRRLDARFRLLRDASGPVRHASEVKLFVGTSETIANIRLLDTEMLNPEEEAWVQLELRDPVVVVRGDRYILRRPSPGETLGGGKIVDPFPEIRHKRFDEKVLSRLESLHEGTSADVLFQACQALGAVPVKEIVSRSRLESSDADDALKELLSAGQLVALEEGRITPSSDLMVATTSHWNRLKNRVTETLESFHRQFPLRHGIPREELKSKLGLGPRQFNCIVRKLTADNMILESSTWIALPGHVIQFDGGQQGRIEQLMNYFTKAPFAPPSVKESQSLVGEDVFSALVERGDLVKVAADVVFRKEDFELMSDKVKSHLQKNSRITVAEVRDMFNTSRKYALAFMEYLDGTGVTARDGDYRRLRN
jgi:selenocysteine-specific elongation factor